MRDRATVNGGSGHTIDAAADGTFGVSAVATNDSVAVTGHLALDGELAVVTTGEFAFAGGQSFDLPQAILCIISRVICQLSG